MANKFKREFKNVVYNYSDAETKVREATSNDPWGPSSALMSELAEYTFHVQAYSLVMGMLWKRLNDSGKNWRHVYKSLTVLEYLIKAGSERVTQQCKDNLFSIQTLKDFQFMDKEGKDQGVNVREKAKQIAALLKDETRLKDERARALLARERKSHVSSDEQPKYPRQPQPAKQVQFSEPSSDDGATASAPGTRVEQNVEQARPTDTSEEELQLKLALQLSKEQADQDDQLRKQEEDTLKAALALSEAESKPEETEAPEEGGGGGNLLLDLDSSGVHGPWDDNVPAEPPPSYDIVTGLGDPWANSVAPPTSETSSQYPFAPQTTGSAAAAPVIFDPWGSSTTAAPVPQPVLSDPWSSLPPADGSLQPLPVSDPSSINPFDLSSLGIPPLQPSPRVSPRGSPAPDRVEDRFLGENAALVDLDALLNAPPTVALGGAAGSTPSNPFGGVPMTSLSSNPFQAGKPAAPTLNQLATANQPGIIGSADLLPPPLIPVGGGSPVQPRAADPFQQPTAPAANQNFNPFS